MSNSTVSVSRAASDGVGSRARASPSCAGGAVGRRRDLAADVAAGRAEKLPAVVAFAHRDDGEHSPQAVPAAEGEAVAGVAAEEGAVDRLEDVFGVELAADQVVEPAARQADEAVGETAKHLRGRVVVAGPEARHQVVEGTVGRRHGRPLPGNDECGMMNDESKTS